MGKFSDNSMAAVQHDEITQALSTLAAGAMISANSRIDASRLQGFRVLKSQYAFILKGLTAEEGPIRVLIGHDLTNTEAEEAIGADPQRSNDPTSDASARSKRPIFVLNPGVFFKDAAGNGNLLIEGEIKLGWSFPEGTILKYYFENFGLSTMTTGAVIAGRVKHYGVWLRD